ncbi:MAG: carboxypeptidase-like regulatory domain-containing protein [Bacteroidales bacterium]
MGKKHLILLLFFCGFLAVTICGLKGHAQNSSEQRKKIIQFSGVMVNAHDLSPIPFATIVINGTGRGAVADVSGFFTFVAVSGDVIKFSSVGYEPALFVIPDSIRADAYSIIQPMVQDTIMLMETVIYPWPSKDKFREAFVSVKLPEQDADIVRKNFNLATMREQARIGKMDANMNYRSLMQEQVGKLYSQGQVSPNNLLNPFAWAQFVKRWKQQKKVKDMEEATDSYQDYGGNNE